MGDVRHSPLLTDFIGEVDDRDRRPDVMSALRNLCIDSDCHERIIASGAMIQILSFIYPWDKVDAAHREQLPKEVQDMLVEGAALTTDGAVRIAAATCVLGLSESEVGSKHLQECGFKEIL